MKGISGALWHWSRLFFPRGEPSRPALPHSLAPDQGTTHTVSKPPLRLTQMCRPSPAWCSVFPFEDERRTDLVRMRAFGFGLHITDNSFTESYQTILACGFLLAVPGQPKILCCVSDFRNYRNIEYQPVSLPWTKALRARHTLRAGPSSTMMLIRGTMCY